MDFSKYGVPQTRKRAIFIGKIGNINNIEIYDSNKKTTIWEAISDLNYLESGEKSHDEPYRIKPESNFQKLMRKDSLGVFNHTATNHSKSAIDRMKMVPEGKGKEFIPKELHTKSTFGNT
jgi:site-specific DNA-cytosine methylase